MCYYIGGDCMYEEALKILKKINMLGYEAYIVGGYPRDKYLNITSYDIDICTNMPPDIIKKNFKVTKDSGYGSLMIEDKFEITTYRRDIYNKNRFPEIEYVSTLEEDLKRRDFIINTLFIDLNGNYIDKLNAIDDLDNKIIRTIKNANISFKEDPLRIIRALRFKIDLNFSLNDDIIESINKNKELLKTISNKRIEKEINKSKNKELIYELIGDVYERKSN